MSNTYGEPAGDEELLAMFDRVSNTGRWGSDDELGTLNLITPEKRLEATRLVRTGRVVSMARPLTPDLHTMVFHGTGNESAYDLFAIACHGFLNTHLDAVSHSQWEGRLYNGRKAADVYSMDGLRAGDITIQREGIVTRGVLLDVARLHGVPALDPDHLIGVAELEAAEKEAGVRVGAGDALFVRGGFVASVRERGLSLPEAVAEVYAEAAGMAGVGAACVEWMRDRDIAVFGGDCTEKIPYPSVRFPTPLHKLGIVSMGLCLLDFPDVEELAEYCAEIGRWEFMLTVAPLVLAKGTGSPVNPLALF